MRQEMAGSRRVRRGSGMSPKPGAAGLAMAFRLIESAQQRWRASTHPTGSPRSPLALDSKTARSSSEPSRPRHDHRPSPAEGAGPLAMGATGQDTVDTLRQLGDPQILCRTPASHPALLSKMRTRAAAGARRPPVCVNAQTRGVVTVRVLCTLHTRLRS